MKVLLIAPQPFYQDRGTPIAVDLLLRSLSGEGHSVDLLTFHEGEEKDYPGVNIIRIKPFPKVKNIKPGFSGAKILCDFYLLVKTISLVSRNKYDVLHAIEEAGFIAWLVKKVFKTPYIFDMDSLMSHQLIDKYRGLKKIQKLLSNFEAIPIRNAAYVLAVCDDLAQHAQSYGAERIRVVKDISLMSLQAEDIKLPEVSVFERHNDHKVLMYIGNLESYQGIDLLISSYALTLSKYENATLVIVGGNSKDIEKYKNLSRELAIDDKTHFLGQQPASTLFAYMKRADILVSPRTQGTNTPMKVYSYLHSKKPVLATRLATHTQVMTDDIAELAEPSVEAFSLAMLKLLQQEEHSQKIAMKAFAFIEREHSYHAFSHQIADLYNDVERIVHG